MTEQGTDAGLPADNDDHQRCQIMKTARSITYPDARPAMKPVQTILALAALVLVAYRTRAGEPVTQVWTLRTDPLRVEARLLHEEPAGPFAFKQYVFEITARAKQGDQVVSTAVSSNTLDGALRSLRDRTVWRSPYLFIHVERGTGTRADGSREAIFELEDGKIHALGQLVDKGDGPTLYHGRRFVDYWGTESSQIVGLCHGCVPTLTVALIDRDGKLEVRRSATWSANQDMWLANTMLIAQGPPPPTADSDSDATFSARLAYFQAVMKNAALAKYCWKSKELDELLAQATPHLNAEQRQDLKDGLSSVMPLTPPSEMRPGLYALNAAVQSSPQ
jgi:hypothetical protein